MVNVVQGMIAWIELTDVFVLVMGRVMLMLAFCCTMGSKADVIGYTRSVGDKEGVEVMLRRAMFKLRGT
jgi:hypothetical protein